MLRVPLKVKILLLTLGGDFICDVEFAGKETLDCRNVKKRIYQDDKFTDIPTTNRLIFDRDKIIGYSYIEDVFSANPIKPKLIKLEKKVKYE